MDGAVQGAKAVRSIVTTIRSLYDRQEHKFAGPYGDNRFLEEYARVEPPPVLRAPTHDLRRARRRAPSAIPKATSHPAIADGVCPSVGATAQPPPST